MMFMKFVKAARGVASLALVAAAHTAFGQVNLHLGADLEELLNQHGSSVSEKLYPTSTATTVEFYNSNLRHYFRTAEQAEIAAINNGAAGPGWTLTGEDFQAWSQSDAVGRIDLLPVCRFYAPGPNSHFYTIDPAECAAVRLDPGWHYEGTSFYAVAVPSSRTCPAGTSPLYRVYNNRFAFNDSNHRFVVKVRLYQQMIDAGWKGEGIVMCMSAISPALRQKTAQLVGGTWSISYTYGTRAYVDRLTYTGFFTSPSSGLVYASGTNQRGIATIGSYDQTLDGWQMISPYFSSSALPADYYDVTINGNTMGGCYYFLVSALSPLTGCANALTGFR